MRYFEKKVRYTIRKYSMLEKKNRVVVAVSGGKDSTVLLYLLHKFGYDVTGMMVEPGIKNYTDKNLQRLEKFCAKHGIPLKVVYVKKEFGKTLQQIQAALKKNGVNMQACAVCGVLKRYLLNKHSKGFDVLCTGHNMDDEAQAFLMNVFRNDTKQVHRGGPKSDGNAFVPRAKPLYLMKEKEVAAYSRAMGFDVFYGHCPLSIDAYRKDFLRFLNAFEKKHPNVKDNIIAFYLSEHWRKTPATHANICSVCGEPASKSKCKACEILSHLNTY